VARPASNVFALRVPGETPVNGLPGPAAPSASAAATPPFDTTSEIFVQDGKNLLQLTDFHRVDTGNAFPSVTPGRAFFTASATRSGRTTRAGGTPRETARYSRSTPAVAGCARSPTSTPRVLFRRPSSDAI